MEPQTSNLNQKILQVLSQHLGIEEGQLVPEADLAKDLNLHSLELSDIASILSDTFKITIAQDEVSAWETVLDVFHTVTEKIDLAQENA